MRKEQDDNLSHDFNAEDLIEDSSRGLKKLFVRFLALFVFLAFTLMVLGNVVQLITIPSRQLILQSLELSKDSQINEWQQAVVAVQAQNRRGTGFNIKEQGLIITNNHIIEEARSVSISAFSASRYPVKKWTRFPGIDLAIIQLEANNLPALKLETETTPIAGDEVTIIGNPLGFFRVVSKGKIAGYAKLDGWEIPILTIKGPIYKGSSGSPVINKDGRVVGVVFATTTSKQQTPDEVIGLALPVDEVLKHIER